MKNLTWNQICGIGIFLLMGVSVFDKIYSIIPSFDWTLVIIRPITIFSLFLTSIVLILLTPATVIYDKLSLLIISIFSAWLQLMVLFLSLINDKIFGLMIFNQNNMELYSKVYYPSIGTIIGMFAVSIGGLIALFNTNKFLGRIRKVGIITLLLGITGLIGTVCHIPMLYFETEFSNGMALFTSLSFVLTGLGFIFCNTPLSKK